MDHSSINQNFELNKSRQNNYDFYTIDWRLVKPGTPEQRNTGIRNSGTPEQHHSGTRNTGTLKLLNLLKIRKKKYRGGGG